MGHTGGWKSKTAGIAAMWRRTRREAGGAEEENRDEAEGDKNDETRRTKRERSMRDPEERRGGEGTGRQNHRQKEAAGGYDIRKRPALGGRSGG
jgi:hypothetical protein